LKKPDTKLQFLRIPGKNMEGIFISFGFLEKSWKEFAIPSAFSKKDERNLEFLRIPGQETIGN